MLMKNVFYLLTFVFLNIYYIASAQDSPLNLHPIFSKAQDSTYIFESVNVITGQYTEVQNDLHLSGPEPFILKRYHTRDDRFLYGWHCNLPNLINDAMPGEAKQFSPTQKISYEYDKKNRLKSFKTSDIYDQNVYSWMNIRYSESPNLQCSIQTHDGQQITYRFLDNYLIAEVISSQKPSISYTYQPHPEGEGHVVSRRELPEGRYVENEYYEKNHPHAGKVKAQKSPVGSDSTPIATHRFIYNNGYTEVYDALNCKTVYRFSKGRITAVENYDNKGKICRLEKLIWTQANPEHSSELKTRYIADGQGTILSARTFSYDAQGHLIKDTLYGNLSGLCAVPITIGNDGDSVTNGIESYSVSYEYSDNLLNSITEDNGKKTLYRYLPKSSHPFVKIIMEGGKTLSREFCFYNVLGQILKIYSDDGNSDEIDDLSNVTERHIKKISYRTEHPAMGLPEIIEEAYLDLTSHREVLYKKIINHYNKQARIIQQDIYDANNHYRYSSYNKYDERGRLISTCDACGHISEHTYDSNNNLLKTTSIDAQGLFQEITNSYDFANRLVSTENFDNDKNVQKVFYQYDVKGNKIAFIDECGNKTAYEYDSLGREIKVIFPKVFDEELNIVTPTKKKSYDALNRVTMETDEKGLATYIQYNARGKPIAIIYPNRRAEKFVYNLDGSLKISYDKPGCYSVFHLDSLGRINKTENYELSGVLLDEILFVHNAFHLLSVERSNKQKINYNYDMDGRLVSLEEQINYTLTKRITYEYNSLGQQVISKEWFGENLEDFIATINEYDVDKKLKTTRIESADGKQQKFIADNETNFSTSFKEEIVVNELGQQVLKKSSTDVSGNVIIHIFDALKRPVKMIKKNIMGEVIGLQDIRWDVNHHKIRETNYLNNDESISTIWNYDSNDRLAEIIEGYGSSHVRRIKYNYNEDGQLTTIVKPDGIKICYQYTPLGDISRLYSSDNTIDYSYTYDRHHNITNVLDNISNTATLRTFAEDGSLLDEFQGNGLLTSRKYDALNRCVRLDLPDNSSVHYKYEYSYLKEIQFRSFSGKTYIHAYQERDPAGKSLVEKLPGNSGQKTHAYDDKNHLISISTPFWSEEITYSSITPNTIVATQIKDSSGKQNNKFSYDAQNRLMKESGCFANSFLYNWLGNQISKNQSIHPLNRRFEQSSTQNPYDANGNLKGKVINKVKLSFEYDALNRLTVVRKDNGEIYRYSYDAFHRRLCKAYYGRNGKKIWEQRYLYDGLNEIGAVDEKDEITELRILGEGLGAEIGSAVLMEFGDKVFVPIHDHRGSVCCLIDAENSKSHEYMHYSAFGEEENDTDTHSPWHFSSKRKDSETGLLYFGKRYYDPSTSQWISQDPLRSIDGANSYAFAANNPLSRIDHYGLFSINTLWANLTSSASSINQKLSTLFNPLNDFINHNLSLEYNLNTHVHDSVLSLFGRNNLILHGYYLDELEAGTLGQGEISDKVRITVINGILNTRIDVMETIEMVSKLHGDNNIHYVFRPTEGWSLDIAKSALVKCGWTSPQAKKLAMRWQELIAEMGGVHEGGKIIHYAHSIGAADTLIARELLSPEEMKMIQVYTFGSPSLFGPEGFHSVTNYVSKGDGVSFLDPVRYIRSLINPIEHVSFLPSSWSIPFIDHPLTFPTYQSILEMLGKRFIELHEKVADTLDES